MVTIRVGSVIAGRYRLEAPIAEGGMGAVWAARHLTLDTLVAIKFIGVGVAGMNEARRRFEREAKAAALLKSPHVVQILDYGVDDDIPYLVMEMLHGEDLGTRLARLGKLSVPEAVHIVTQVARGLRPAAELGVVHRDLKPSNVFIVSPDDEGNEVVKVLDFGVAKAPCLTVDEATRSGAMIGSPRYMSPEQARGRRLVDPRSDLWSLAVIAYRALTGETPFQGDDIADLLINICTESPVPPSEIDPALGPEMDEFFERALAREPDERFQTPRELAAAFAEAANMPPPSVTSVPSKAPILEAPSEPRRTGTLPSMRPPPHTQGDARSYVPRSRRVPEAWPAHVSIVPPSPYPHTSSTGESPTLPTMRSPVYQPEPEPPELPRARAPEEALGGLAARFHGYRRSFPLATVSAGVLVAALAGGVVRWFQGGGGLRAIAAQRSRSIPEPVGSASPCSMLDAGVPSPGK